MSSIAKVALVLALISLGSLTWAKKAYSIDASDGLSVITGTQTSYSLTLALLQDTPIETINIPADGRRLASLKDYIERRKDRFQETFESADALVAYTNLIGYDPLYRFAREANIHLIYIDAAQPWGYNSTSVSLVEEPTTNVGWAKTIDTNRTAAESIYFWLSTTNAVRMSDIIGNDLARIFPNHSLQILNNLSNLKTRFLTLNREFQDRLLEVSDISVFALANEFVYLTNEMGLFVDGYFLKQDIDWTEEDLSNLTDHLKRMDIGTVLHKWEPSEAIQKAVTDAGAQIVVLDTADPGLSENRALVPDGYQQILESNLEKIIQALGRK